MIENNGWPGKHGVPPKQEYRGWHWLYLYNGIPSPAYWDGYWIMNGSRIQAEDLNPQINYWGECLTPAEVDARVTQARRDALKKAAQWHDEQAKRWQNTYAKETLSGLDMQAARVMCLEHGGFHIESAAASRALGEKE